MDANALIRLYPWLDHLMADTLLKLSAQGKLEAFLETATSPQEGGAVISGAVTVQE